MKKSKRIISLFLSLIIFFGVMFSLELNVFATDDNTRQFKPMQSETETLTETQAETETLETVTPTVEATQEPTQAQTEAETVPPTTTVVVDETKVGQVGKLNKDTKFTDEIQFFWDAVEGAQGYRVYYKNNDKDEDYSLLVTTTSTKITVRDLPHTTPFQFKVAAFVVEDEILYEGLPSIGKTATQPATTNKPSLKKCSSSTKISWNENSLADGYRIYRQDSSTKGKLVLYKTIKSSSTTTFEDKNVKKGRAYNYQVRAYREMYKGKTYVGEGSTLRTVSGLTAPTVNSCTSQLRRVTIDWNNNSVAQGYDVYYKADDRTSYKLLKNTKSTYLNTDHLRAGHTYSFKIRPYKYVGANKTKVYGCTRAFTKKVTSAAYGQKIGKTYIEISIAQQHMWYYIDGKCYVSTDVVTGNQGAYSTPKGAYKIWQRSSPATLSGPTWCVNVKYWMAFTYSGCGIHDATWRDPSEFGGTTYKGNGSHGCVNTPYNDVKKIYKKAGIGTNVVVY